MKKKLLFLGLLLGIAQLFCADGNNVDIHKDLQDIINKNIAEINWDDADTINGVPTSQFFVSVNIENIDGTSKTLSADVTCTLKEDGIIEKIIVIKNK